MQKIILERRKNVKNIKTLLVVMLTTLLCASCFISETKAADSYRDPKTFFDTCNDRNYHVEFTDGSIFYATKGRTSQSASNTRFRTIGFRITATGNRQSMSICVKRNGLYLKDVAGDVSYSDGFTYNLYQIKYETIAQIMNNNDANLWATINNGSYVTFRMDAIMTTVPSGSNTPVADVATESNGYLTYTNGGNGVYCVGDAGGLAAMEETFGKGTFQYYYNIQKGLFNNNLVVYYFSGADGVTSSKGYQVNGSQQICYGNGSAYLTSANRFNFMKLPDPVADLGLYKEGYEPKKGREWINQYDTAGFSPVWYYTPLVNSQVNQGSTATALYVNWEPVTYSVVYMNAFDEAAPTGYWSTQVMQFDKSYSIYPSMHNGENYNFIGWNTKADGTGKWYYAGDIVKNLLNKGDSLILYAQWEPMTFEIKVDNGGSGSIEKFYEKYKTYFLLEENSEDEILTIAIPDNKTGYTFAGFYTSPYVKTEMIADELGRIVVGNTYYTQDDTVYAWYEPNIYNITFNQQEGSDGTLSTEVAYDSYPPADLIAPRRNGYTFMGYYTAPNGKGDCYFNAYMAPLKVYQVANDLDLYAYWVDDNKPEAKLYIPDDWSNNPRGIEIGGYARDNGSGLQKVVVYLELSNKDEVVKTYDNLNGKKEITLEGITHTIEGAFVYRMEVWDMGMNVTETAVRVYKPAKYDITAPTGKVNENSSVQDFSKPYLEIYTTDYKTN